MESSRRKIILLLLVLIISIPALTPVTLAYDGAFLQVTISSSPYQYVGLRFTINYYLKQHAGTKTLLKR